ncbi:MAG: 3-deoxy-D-manno-octulosonic acid transferase, partial [Psychroserpens sp.]|nr:3-deoxy-D-manno-octulosonic acid transferase [Psychroserpens sp.]
MCWKEPYFSKNKIGKHLYDIGIYLFSFVLRVLSVFNPKIKKGVKGRKETFARLAAQLDNTKSSIWFHCASLGEYEQGLPVFEHIRDTYPDHHIVLSFFSPSGYEIRKNTPIADTVVYLPIDTKANAKRFVDLIQPALTVFVKYDIWSNLLLYLHQCNLPAILISAAFRKNQLFFKPYGNKQKSALKTFDHIFVQNEDSKGLLYTIGYTAVTVSGDTRFDRVSNQLKQDNTIDFITAFKGDSLCIVIGSSWQEDEAILLPYINKHASANLKFIIAPHEINKTHINDITSKLTVDHTVFSSKDQRAIEGSNVFVVDTIGLLSKIYSYADIAYVGGAMGTTGLHNILEPAVFGC